MEKLSREQSRASRPGGGVTLVIAGAGTGKTKTLISKITAIIGDSGISPKNILVLTFSRKAAEEIRSRVREVIGEMALGLVAGTFHSFCLSLLMEYSGEFKSRYGYSDFPTVIEEDERKRIIKGILMGRLDDFIGIPLDIIESFVDDPHKCEGGLKKRLDLFGLTEKILDARKAFQAEKARRAVVDFQDLMTYTLNMLENNGEIRMAVRERCRYVLVDEFQDTSPENFRLLRLILDEKSPNLFVVGDDWQSIYGFRYSNIDYIVRMRHFFPDADIHRLTANYRSLHEIVRLSNRLIRNNRYRTRKRLKSYRGRGGLVRRHIVQGREQENEAIAGILNGMAGRAGSLAILYRNNWQGRIISRFLENRMPGEPPVDLQMMTIHASKGLEFNTVIVAGITDAILPDPSSDIEEERRLMYVALTRARDELHLICHKGRGEKLSIFGQELGEK